MKRQISENCTRRMSHKRWPRSGSRKASYNFIALLLPMLLLLLFLLPRKWCGQAKGNSPQKKEKKKKKCYQVFFCSTFSKTLFESCSRGSHPQQRAKIALHFLRHFFLLHFFNAKKYIFFQKMESVYIFLTFEKKQWITWVPTWLVTSVAYYLFLEAPLWHLPRERKMSEKLGRPGMTNTEIPDFLVFGAIYVHFGLNNPKTEKPRASVLVRCNKIRKPEISAHRQHW